MADMRDRTGDTEYWNLRDGVRVWRDAYMATDGALRTIESALDRCEAAAQQLIQGGRLAELGLHDPAFRLLKEVEEGRRLLGVAKRTAAEERDRLRLEAEKRRKLHWKMEPKVAIQPKGGA